MKYACFGYFDRHKMDALSKDEMDRIIKKCKPRLMDLYGSANFLMDVGVKPVRATLGRRNGNITKVDASLTTGMKNEVGNVFIIEAENIEQAIETAKKHPAVCVPEGEDLGWAIEIHEIHTDVTR